MPCRTDLINCTECGGEHYWAKECLKDPSKYGEGLIGYNPKEAVEKGQKAIDKAQKALLKKLASFDIEGALCDVLTLLEDSNLLGKAAIPSDILEWWDGHQSRETQKVKKEALAKLSEKEKRALGLVK